MEKLWCFVSLYSFKRPKLLKLTFYWNFNPWPKTTSNYFYMQAILTLVWDCLCPGQIHQNIIPCTNQIQSFRIMCNTSSPPAHGAEQSERTTPQLYSGFLSVRGRVYSHTTPGFLPWRRICQPKTSQNGVSCKNSIEFKTLFHPWKTH